MLAGCNDIVKDYPKGTYICMKLDGQRGMIVGWGPGSSILRVRFAISSSKTDVALLGPDNNITHSPYSVVRVFTVEVAKCPNI